MTDAAEASVEKRPREEEGDCSTPTAAVDSTDNNNASIQHSSLAVDNDAPAAKRVKTTSDQDDVNHGAKNINTQERKPESFVETVFSAASTRSQRTAMSSKGHNSEGGAENGEKKVDVESTSTNDNDETVDTAGRRWRGKYLCSLTAWNDPRRRNPHIFVSLRQPSPSPSNG